MKYAIALLIVLCSLSTYAHKETFPATLSGKVVDGQTGEPLIGARIAVDGHYYQVFTKPDGTFEIDVPVTEKSVIVVEMISYEDVTLSVSVLHSTNTISLVSN